MNNLPRQMLRQIFSKYGTEIISDARRCESLLNDLCGSHRREINVLINALEERIPIDLLNGAGSMPMELLLNRLEKRLEEQTAMTAEAARWAVESWATALDLVSENDIHTRNKRKESAAPPNLKVETSQPDDYGDVISNINRRQPTQLPTAPHSRNNPPVRQPAQMPKPTPPNIFPTNNQLANPIPHQPTMNQTVIVGKGFGIFRGCLLVASLLVIVSVVLFLGVPFAIEKMRETQYERNNEPPRFPVR